MTIKPSKNIKGTAATADDYARLQSKPVFDVPEAALYLNLAPKTVRRMTRSGRIPSFRLGRFHKYSRAALDEMIAKMGGARSEV
ncbi:MAG: helix-turn-helix domain-containing protein [Verrucomicrobia bacterium]|nr:helix-turn-helix domain-containing protein [Verrucomicrobiota bacterium]